MNFDFYYMCVFCQIIKKQINSEIVYEDEKMMVIKDINPKAPVHLLLFPERHIESLVTLRLKDRLLIEGLIWKSKSLAEEQGFASNGYKLVLNCGQGAGQVVPHLHLHLLSGADFSKWPV